MNRQRHVALVSGFWGQNIGNAFYNIGGKYILEQVFPNCNVQFIQDQPGYRTPGYKLYQKQRNPRNDLILLKHLNVDYLVLQGPMLTKTFRTLWEETFRELQKKGTKIILLSAALFKHTEEEIQLNRKFLEEYPPTIISTRDSSTYSAFKNHAEYVYDGIDSAFFVPDVYSPLPLDLHPYIVVNFNRFPEPQIELLDKATEKHKYDVVFEALNLVWGLRFPRLQMIFSRMGKWQSYIGALVDFRRLPLTIGGYNIVRTEHRFTPHVTWKIYRQGNVVCTDEPFSYFTIYAGSSLTLTDRVHAAVVTLAYGNPAMLFTPSPRAELFDRLGLSDIRNKPVSLDPQKLQQEKAAQIEFLKEAIAKLERAF